MFARLLPPYGILRHPITRILDEGINLSPAKAKVKPAQHLRGAMPLLKELVRPRKGKLALGFVLMVINRLCSLVMPGSIKWLVDRVVGRHEVWLLNPLIAGVFAATVIQGITSFSLTQLLSKEGQ